jgi:hypothetical protein
LRSKISTEITLVSEVNSMIAADNSRMTLTKMKHQVDRRRCVKAARYAGERAGAGSRRGCGWLPRDRIDHPECRIELPIGRRQRDGDEGDQQHPQGAVEHEGRLRVAQEQPDAEHDTGTATGGGEEAGALCHAITLRAVM